MTDAWLCPRRVESPFQLSHGPDAWREDDTCSYCGSLNPETFLARLETGDVSLEPTSKSYKVYVRNRGGELFLQTYRIDEDRSLDQSQWVWTTRETPSAKFYFQHLANAQKARFVELHNTGRLHLERPFSVLPFFMFRGPRA